TGTVSPFRLMARPEIKNPADLKGKRAGITTFGSTSDQIVRMALKHFNLEPNKDVALLSFGAQPEVFAALQSGAVQAGALSFPLYAKATQLGMRELVNFGDLGIEDINGTVITTRSYIAQHRDIVLRFPRFHPRHASLPERQGIQQKSIGQIRQNPGRRYTRGHLAGLRSDVAENAAAFAQSGPVFT